MTQPLRLFYWANSAYESVILIFAPDASAAHQLCLARVHERYGGDNEPTVYDDSLVEVPVPDEPQTILIETWDWNA